MRRFSLGSRASQLCFGIRGEVYSLDGLGNMWVCSLGLDRPFPVMQLRSTLGHSQCVLRSSLDGRWLLYRNSPHRLRVLFSIEDQPIEETSLTDSFTWEENIGVQILMRWNQESLPHDWFESPMVDFVEGGRYLVEASDWGHGIRIWDLEFHTRRVIPELGIGFRADRLQSFVLPDQKRIVYPQPMPDHYWVLEFPEFKVVGSFYSPDNFLRPVGIVGRGHEVHFGITRYRAIAMNPHTLKRIGDFPFPQAVECVAVNREHTILLTGHKKPNVVRQWRIPTGLDELWHEVSAWDWEVGLPEALAIDPTNTMAAVTGNRKKLVVFDLEG